MGVVKLMLAVPKVKVPSFATRDTERLLWMAEVAEGNRMKKDAL